MTRFRLNPFALLWLLGVTVSVETVAAPAAPGQYQYQNETCAFSGTLRRPYSRQQLDDTVAILREQQSSLLSTPSFAFHPDQWHKISIAALDAEYLKVHQRLQQRQPITTGMFKNIKAMQLSALAQEYRIARAVAQSYDQPTVLLRQPGTAACQRFAQRLNAPTAAARLAGWKATVLEDEMPTNSLAWSRFQQESSRADWEGYARINQIRQWNNCALRVLPEPASIPDWAERFNQLVFRGPVQQQCDEP